MIWLYMLRVTGLRKEWVRMLAKDHMARHVLLHNCLDELVADWIGSGPSRRPSKGTILELMQWSSGQTKRPDCVDIASGHDDREGNDGSNEIADA